MEIDETNHYHYVEFTRVINGESTTYNSYEDWGLYLTEPVAVSAPEPNTYMVAVPGRNGSLDLTESMIGTVTYQDREIEFAFVCRKKRNEWNAVYQKILQAIHGKRCEITCSDDPEYTYEGRVILSKWSTEDKMAFPTLKATVRPFKTKKTESVYTATLTSETENWVEITGGTYETRGSGSAKLTTIQFGSKNVPSVDWDNYSALRVSYTKGSTGATRTSAAVYSGSVGTANVEQTAGPIYTWTLESTDVVSAFVWANIYKITVSGNVTDVTIYGKTRANAVITVDGSDKPVIPDILTTADVKITVNGQTYEVTTSPYYNENIVIREGKTAFSIAAMDTVLGTETVTIQYREGSL